MSKVIRPEGMDLINCRNNGTPICKECGAIMNRKDNGQYCDILVCPGCGFEIDDMDYEFEEDEEDYDSIYDEDDSTPPKGCIACGGPYPYCKTSCKIFDD